MPRLRYPNNRLKPSGFAVRARKRAATADVSVAAGRTPEAKVPAPKLEAKPEQPEAELETAPVDTPAAPDVLDEPDPESKPKRRRRKKDSEA